VPWLGAYARPENPLFVPEIAGRPENAVEALYALGHHDAIGFSPFAIDSIGASAAAPLAEGYLALAGLAPPVLARHGPGRPEGVLLPGDPAPARPPLRAHR